MIIEIMIRYLHFLGIFVVVGSLIGEHLLLKRVMTRTEIKRLARLDTIYGVAFLVVLVCGFLMWFVVGKPADFYSFNWIFHLKVGLLIIMGLLSIVPTLFFWRNKKGEGSELVEVPTSLKIYIRLELLILFLTPLLATLMARGIGFFGE